MDSGRLQRQRVSARAAWEVLTRQWLPRIWPILSLVSVAIVAIGAYYASRQLATGNLRVAPSYLALAAAIFVVAYALQALGWHHLATHFLGPLPMQTNVEAMAASSLVRSLPTVAWYIANRMHFYTRRSVPQRSVAVASLIELLIMLATGTFLYTLYWLARVHFALVPVGAVGFGLLFMGTARGGAWLRRRQWRWLLRLWPVGPVALEPGGQWRTAVLLYGASWPLGVCMLWAALNVFIPVDAAQFPTVFNIWLLMGLVSYVGTLTLGGIGIGREITLTFLLAQHWPLSVAVASAVVIKLVLTLGEIVCGALILAWLRINRKSIAHE